MPSLNIYGNREKTNDVSAKMHVGCCTHILVCDLVFVMCYMELGLYQYLMLILFQQVGETQLGGGGKYEYR